MRYVIYLMMVSALSVAAEVEVRDANPADAEQLQTNYAICQKELQRVYRENLKLRDSSEGELRDHYERRILSLESSLEEARKQEHRTSSALKRANRQIEQLNRLVADQKRHIATLSASEAPQADFPKLIPKETGIAAEAQQASEAAIVYFKAAAFETTETVPVRDAPAGNPVTTWEAETSFTSNQKQGGWIRVTGYFVDRKWRPSREESLWIRESKVRKKR
jgi:hypothetical protein